ncbi:uncharacterized protein LOC132039470 [Lycium ferocissimum]|uniref:uncharacterized protein LOC132039470 n=1 Tax=Lycium ferocissimum TaxID=112874 RepID=UPI0028159921|nr:uncharacterized protein LOC132039470 [Lycium ferocissimum]
MRHTNEDVLQHIPCKLDQKSNEMLCKVPSNEKVKAAVFNLSGSSASGLDGFSGFFYRVCWSIVEADVLRMSMHDKLEKVLPTLISPHQAGFMKGRSIIENVLLTQDIVTDIRKRGKPDNVILKLDMAKAYDRVSWKEISRALNSLYDNSLYVGYGLPKWSANINHLVYADDTIIFASAKRNSLQMIMDILKDYEAISGQLINIEKSAFYMYHKVVDRVMQDVQQVTGFTKGQFPFKYLGCPIFHPRKKKVYYQDLIKKVKDKLQSWKGKFFVIWW